MKTKILYNLDNKNSFSDFIKRKTKKLKTFDAPQMKSGLNVCSYGYGTLIKNSLAYYYVKSNNIMNNNQQVFIISSTCNTAHGISVLPINYLDVVSNFTSRKLFIGKYSTWLNQKDEYVAPSEEIQQTDKYKQFNNDTIVYSLFNSHSQQSSIRNVEYKDKLWNIKNEFFWLNKNTMIKNKNIKMENYYEDLNNSEERFVYKLLNGKLTSEELEEVGLDYVDEYNRPILSPDAQELLDLSKELILKSFKYREELHKEHPEYHLNTWDAGWYQIKKILNIYMKDEYKEFVKKYKAFEDRLRPQIYEFGILLK